MPIYIHSLFRSGSTYFFNKFREFDENYQCYQEPFNEHLLNAKENPDKLLEVHEDTSKVLRHPILNKPYFYEFHSIAKDVSKYLDESLCYKKFFDSEDGEGNLHSYINSLTGHIDKVPVLQMCRSFGRVDAFNDGYNIFLWRNPWDQWWSYKVTNYFSVRNLLILNAVNLPSFLNDVRKEVGISKINVSNLDLEIKYFERIILDSKDSYFIFYALWFYSLIENHLKMDLLINIDSLTISESYRRDVSNKIKAMYSSNIDFSDCQSPVGEFSEEEISFFEPIEKKVQKLLLKEYSEKQIDCILSLKNKFSPDRTKNIKKSSLLKEVSNLRKVIIGKDEVFYDYSKNTSPDNVKNQLSREISLLQKNDRLHLELHNTHQDNERISQQYLLIMGSNSWKVIRRLHPLLNFFKGFSLNIWANYKDKPVYSNTKNQELIIDITHTYQKDLKTGIQRVVRSILKGIEEKNFKNTYIVRAIYLNSKGVYKYCNNKKDVVPKHGDVFLGLDLNARVVELDPLLKVWTSRGVSINFVVYDIIPILHPYWWESNVSIVHEQWLRMVLKYSSNIACISNSVANDVKAYYKNTSIAGMSIDKIRSFHLGADVENSIPTTGIPKNATKCRESMSKRNTFLMVGTIEPRKGYQMVLDTFNILWTRNEEVNLVIVGKEGWMMYTLLSEIKNHQNFNKNLFYFENASDEFLIELYENSTCLLAASEAEGFGLPLVEAALYNLPVIARDLPVFKEIADGHASFFDADSLTVTILQWLKQYKVEEHPKNDNMRTWTWDQSAQELIDIIEI